MADAAGRQPTEAREWRSRVPGPNLAPLAPAHTAAQFEAKCEPREVRNKNQKNNIIRQTIKYRIEEINKLNK
jgi:hypothetical protein